MKRSEINSAIQALTEFAEDCRFKLPPFAHWTPQDWRTKGPEYDEIRSARLGWDVTDFGKGDFAAFGLTLFTIRNGRHDRSESKPYGEKLMLVLEKQITPMHFHWRKTEDIINRGGGQLICQVYASDRNEGLAGKPIRVVMDGRQVEVAPGTELVLAPGESITLTPGLYHAFWAEPGRGRVLVGEVSAVNDDATDNRFLEELPRFPGIEEDQSPLRLLCMEYPPPPSGPATD
ncbi:MAG: D-lyxose/D-mannose family sugar isomerase [bacterium]|nr:D-lyxose/D-mannose family sugar isomerase [bacterium]